MEITLDDVSGLPDALKTLAQEADGKFKLNLAQLVPASELETFKGKALTAQAEAIDRRKDLAAWKKLGETPEEIQAKLSKGADPEIVRQLQEQLTTRDQTYKTKLTSILGKAATAELKAELSKAGVVPEGLDILASFAASRIHFDDEGEMRIMAEDGKTPMIGKGSNGGATLADLAAKLAGSIPHLVKDGGASGGGKPPGSKGGTPDKTITRAAFEALPHKERAATISAGTTVTD